MISAIFHVVNVNIKLAKISFCNFVAQEAARISVPHTESVRTLHIRRFLKICIKVSSEKIYCYLNSMLYSLKGFD